MTSFFDQVPIPFHTFFAHTVRQEAKCKLYLLVHVFISITKGVGRKISGWGGNGKKIEKYQNYRKIALLSLFQGGQQKKGRKIAKKTEK